MLIELFISRDINILMTKFMLIAVNLQFNMKLNTIPSNFESYRNNESYICVVSITCKKNTVYFIHEVRQ